MRKVALALFLLLLLPLNVQATIDFDGIDDSVNISDANNLTFGDGSSTDSPFSMSAWVKMRDATRFRVFTKYDGANGEYLFSMDGSDKLRLTLFDNVISNPTRADVISSTTFTAQEGNWIHLAATYDGSGTLAGMKLYVSGVELEYSAASTMGASYAAMHNTAAGLYVGWYNGTGKANGEIEQAVIYTKELSATVVAQVALIHDFYGPRSLQPNSRVVDLVINDKERSVSADGVTIVDFSGKGNNGVGSDGANNTGCTFGGSKVLSMNYYLMAVLQAAATPPPERSKVPILRENGIHPIIFGGSIIH
jgi:hypothetical protein